MISLAPLRASRLLLLLHTIKFRRLYVDFVVSRAPHQLLVEQTVTLRNISGPERIARKRLTKLL